MPADERRARGTLRNSRELTCGKQALFAVVWFRKREDIAVLGAGFGISRATAYRYHDEAITVLAERAPHPHDALERKHAEGMAYVIPDGKIFSADRCGQRTTSAKGTQIDLWYSGKPRARRQRAGPVRARRCPAVGGRHRTRLRA